MSHSPIIVALDYNNSQEAINLAQQLDPTLVRLKVGKELFVSAGPSLIESLHKKNFEIFLDLKFHDIPNTAAQACLAAAKLGVWMTNIHATGGEHMMRCVMERLSQCTHRPLITAVTILTSMNETTLKTIGFHQTVEKQVLNLARLAKDCGLDGVVCSAQEAELLKKQLGKEFKLVTPGIRLQTNLHHDQQRIMTPEKALAAGSDYLVIGRSITLSGNPHQTIEHILAHLP